VKFYLVNPSNPAKTEKIHGRITLEQVRDKSGSNSPPLQGNVQIPPTQAQCTVKCPGYAGGGGDVEASV